MSQDSTKVDIPKALSVAKNAALKGREVLLDHFGNLKQVQEKDKAGLVTEADERSEKEIVAILRAAFPEIEVVAEEETYKKSREVRRSEGRSRWLIDPLDGTTNFVHRFPIYCVSIGLEVDNEVVLAVIDVPSLDRVYTAQKGEGAFCNNLPIQVSHRDSLEQSLLATGFLVQDEAVLEKQLQWLKAFMNLSRGVRRAGSAAFDLCMVAEGVFDLYWETDLKPWDTAAGGLLVQESGGRVTDFEGKKYDPYKQSLLASNGLLHDEALSRLRSIRHEVLSKN